MIYQKCQFLCKIKGTEPAANVRAYAQNLGESTDDAGHILANRLGGFAVPTNIFPQSPHENRGEYRTHEAAIYSCIGASTKASLSWSFKYAGTGTRPTSVTYTASFTSPAAGCDQSAEGTITYTNAAASQIVLNQLK